MSMDKIKIGNIFLQFHKNKKLIIIHKPIYGDDQKTRRIIVPIKIVKFAKEFKTDFRNGERKHFDSFWIIFEDEFGGEDYICFQKEQNGARIP